MWKKVVVKLSLRNTQNCRIEGGGGEKNQEIKGVSQSFNFICLRLYFLDKIQIFVNKGK